MTELVDGQIYRWQWKDTSGWGQSDSYWCRSRIAIVKNGRLIDTYWSDGSLDHAVKFEDVDLTFMGDEKWPKVSEGEAMRYDSADICDTRHANHSRAPIYVRPGAQLNKAAMLAVLNDREQEARSDIRIATWRLEEIAKQRADLEAGKLAEVRF